MKLWQFGFSRRSTAFAAAFACVLSLVIGAHAALNKRALELGRGQSPEQASAGGAPSRVALVIGNGHYPDAAAPLSQPVNDARTLSAALRQQGFDVESLENAGREDMQRAVARLTARIKPDTVAMLFFGGYGIQSGRDNYMMPTDAAIWKESDVRRQGVSVEAVLAAMSDKGARAKLVAIDASRRNPYERRFRGYSHGLASIGTSDNALVISSASPGRVADDGDTHNSLMVSGLIDHLVSSDSAEAAFGKTKADVSRLTDGHQVPTVSSSLIESVTFNETAGLLAKAGS